MGFRCEPELPISSSLNVSDLTLSGREAGVALAEGAGAQSTPRAHLEGCRCRIRLQPARVCGGQSYLRHAPGTAPPASLLPLLAPRQPAPVCLTTSTGTACRAIPSLSENSRVSSFCTPGLFIYLYYRFKN